ncbi:MAG TPA: MBL fold metallo-hydrolase [Longimicrobiaceae bacterium]|nr:MBL fold metallo-hydrolase [Longimicrobiaceae bacterium]
MSEMPGSTHGEMVVRAFSGGPFAQNGYLVSCVGSKAAILVDPGGAVDEMLAAARAQALTIEAIVLTHAHVDHVDGVAEAKRETGAPILLHPDGELLYRNAPAQALMFGLHMGTLPPADRELRGGDTVRFGGCALEVRDAPGHAPGHVILVGDGFALVGDCIFAGSIGRTDLPGGDLQTLMRSIREQILTLPDETVLYSGHGPETTVGHERVSNPFLVPDFGGSRFA